MGVGVVGGGCDAVPLSGKTVDECGVCGGDSLSCAGCDGVPWSGLVDDACFVCAGDNSTCAGCDGVPWSGLLFDKCEVCGGDGSSSNGFESRAGEANELVSDSKGLLMREQQAARVLLVRGSPVSARRARCAWCCARRTERRLATDA